MIALLYVLYSNLGVATHKTVYRRLRKASQELNIKEPQLRSNPCREANLMMLIPYGAYSTLTC